MTAGGATTPEFSRPVRVRDIGVVVRDEALTARPVERAALAVRFGLLALDRLTATLALRQGLAGIAVRGELEAAGTQPCAISGEPVPFALTEPLALQFSPALPEADELELSETDLDIMPLDGDHIDLGEAVAQSLGLALDPYPRAPDEIRAEAARFIISEEEAAARAEAAKAAANPFSALLSGRSSPP